MARQTSGQPRWQRPTPYRRGSPDTPSLRGSISWDRDLCASPVPRSSAACWHRQQSGWHGRRSLPHPLAGQQYTPRQPARTRDGKPLPRGSARYGRVRTPNDPGWRPQYRACKTKIGEVHLHLATDQALRTDCEDIPHDQHPDHQLRIDGRATHERMVRCKFAAKPRKIERGVDLPHQVIFGDRIFKIELIEKLTLVTLQTASPRFASTQRNHGSWPASTDFCNKICTKRQFAQCKATSGVGGR